MIIITVITTAMSWVQADSSWVTWMPVQFNQSVREPLLALQQAGVTAGCVEASEKMKQIQAVEVIKFHPWRVFFPTLTIVTWKTLLFICSITLTGTERLKIFPFIWTWDGSSSSGSLDSRDLTKVQELQGLIKGAWNPLRFWRGCRGRRWEGSTRGDGIKLWNWVWNIFWIDG